MLPPPRSARRSNFDPYVDAAPIVRSFGGSLGRTGASRSENFLLVLPFAFSVALSAAAVIAACDNVSPDVPPPSTSIEPSGAINGRMLTALMPMTSSRKGRQGQDRRVPTLLDMPPLLNIIWTEWVSSIGILQGKHDGVPGSVFFI
jgi:hypothetical protein